jgi:hypothetical protein
LANVEINLPYINDNDTANRIKKTTRKLRKFAAGRQP